ncbi:phosphate transport system protein [Constrictibacter sp. MBR-5]|jgi:phosphate transport system protein|uniref:phosphate signaling complex protein PhoU n=1 Tax=Constrictibacter sp. MBR-5 TaxID=3156467 RepID=UPI003393F2D7
MSQQHIVASYDAELSRLNQLIAEMGGLAESQLATAVDALSRRDSKLAANVVAQDSRVDALENEVDNFAVRLLALRQPMASDLRNIVGSIRIAADLERIADYAANVAKRTIALNQNAPVEPARAIPRMSRLVAAMIKDVLDAYVDRDVAKAIDVWGRDIEVDDAYSSLFRELLTYMMEDPRNITVCTHLLFIAKNIERIGDHITNIAETIHFAVSGQRLVQARPKTDETPFAAHPGDAPAGAAESKDD